MRKVSACICWILLQSAFLILQGQSNRYGVPIITNYEHYVTGGSEQNWCITQDFRGVMYIGNNDKGVLEYDGVEWRTIPLPNNPIVRSLVTGNNGIVYVGAQHEFGYLSPDGFGNMHYRSLSDTLKQEVEGFNIGDVWKTYYVDKRVYFCTFNKIFIYNPSTDELVMLDTPAYAFFSFFIDHELYVGDYGRGLMKQQADTFVLVRGGDHFREMNISGLVRFDSTRLLVGTYEKGIFLLDRETGKVNSSFVDSRLNEYFKSGVITYLHPQNNDFAVATQFGGLVILDRNGEAKEIITQAEGMIDQTIPYVYSNQRLEGSGPVWIAHFQGVSKLETNNPFRVFTERSGFEGFITDIAIFDHKLFISTFGGLYYRESTSTGTKFIAVPEIQDQMWNLFVFRPAPGVELLLASAQSETMVIGPGLDIYSLEERIINLPDNIEEREDYGGYQIIPDPGRPDVIYTGRVQVIGLQYLDGRWKEILRIRDLPDERLRMAIDKYGYLWTNTTGQGVIRLDTSGIRNAGRKFINVENGLPSNDRNKVFTDPDTGEILLGTTDGFYRYNYFRDTVYRDTLYNRVLPEGKNYIMAFHRDMEGDYWFSFENEYDGWSELVARRTEDGMEAIREKSFQRLPKASTDVFFSDPQEGVWFGKSNELYHFDKSFARNDTLPFRTLIRNIYINNNDSLLYHGTDFIEDEKGNFTIHPSQAEDTRPLIKYRYNNIEFRWAAPYFEQENKMEYAYWLENFDEDWSEWTGVVYKDFTNLPFGEYTLHVRARNVYGDLSVPATYSFTILRPWYATVYAIIAYIILSGLVIYLIIKLYTRRLKQENIRLEGIIQERTAEIRKQKEELTDSIEYASRIQRALLPHDRLMEEQHIEHFILFRPRDIVSGDFYWMASKDDKLLIVAADCTGHGVPGAFMSMLGMTFLDEIVIKSDITSTERILESLREHVITSLKQSGKSMEESTKDGMDLAMVCLDKKSRLIQFSGAYNPLYLVRKLSRQEKEKIRKGEELDLPRGSIHDHEHLLLQIRGDQMPIGISEKKLPFTSTTLKNDGFNIYMFSDGFLDQFGGPKGKKFMSKNFKKLILELQGVPLKEQGIEMEKVLLEWMGKISQIDDILVMGLRMN
ncbi:MAG: triple tyrosine motif-containing protein [Bacteroidales bacterium]